MSRFALSRRSALALMGGAATFGLTGRLAHAAGEIKVLNWQGYGTDEKWALEMFEKKTGIKVVHDYFNSEQEMLTKLRTSPGTYDVVLMNNIYVMEAAHEGLIQALDTVTKGTRRCIERRRGAARLRICRHQGARAAARSTATGGKEQQREQSERDANGHSTGSSTVMVSPSAFAARPNVSPWVLSASSAF